MNATAAPDTVAGMPARPNNPAMTGKEFHELLEAAGVTQRALAEQLGVHHVTLSRWASGHTPISKANALLIRATLNAMTKAKKK